MKSINKIILGLALAIFSFSACQDEPDKIIFTGKIIYFSQESSSLLENAETPLELTVELSSPATSEVTVTFTTEDDGATKDVDYTLAQNSIIIPAGQSSASIEILPINNEELDPARRFTITIASVSAGDIAISAERETTVTLVNDDCPVKTGIWATAKTDNADEDDGFYIYTATFTPNAAGDCNVLIIENIGDWGGGTGPGPSKATINFSPNSEGATFGTVQIPLQGINSFGGSGERTAEGAGTYDESTKIIEVFITYKFGDGSVAYETNTVFDAN